MTNPGPDQHSPKPPKAGIGGLPTWVKIGVPAAILGCLACLCCLAAAFAFREPLKELIDPVDPGDFVIDPPAGDGSISGVYRYTNLLGAHRARFTVSADGVATFFLDGAPESETLTVTLTEDQGATLSWRGTEWDGEGPLTPAEQTALEALLAHDLGHGITVIPLQAGCRWDDAPSPQQVASLLVPLQMRLKYLVADRSALLDHLSYFAACREKEQGEWKDVPTIIQLGPGSPVPVVFGYFPFDEDGAVEEGESRAPEAKTAFAGWAPAGTTLPLASPGFVSADAALDEDIRWNETGPCDATCRGACGADCHSTNCKESILMMCQKDETGRYTGMEIRVKSYTCGLHQGCIEHDLCYDGCNLLFGCKTWAAAFCRHGHPRTLSMDPSVPRFCDEAAIAKYGFDNAKLWVQGLGPQTSERIFDYPDLEFTPVENHDKCPPGFDEEAEKEPAESPKEGEGEAPAGEPPADTEGEPPPVQDEESKAEQPKEEEEPPQPGPPPIDPCDLLPSGGTLSGQHDETTCFKTYSAEPAERTVQIWVNIWGLSSDVLCDRFVEPSDFHTIVASEEYGDCGFRVEYGYKGEPAPGYDGWGVQFYLGNYHISVSSRTDDYPAHSEWIYRSAAEAEDNIREYLGLEDN